MSLIVWNCRGLGNLVTEKELHDLTRAKDPFVVFIIETWTNEARLKIKNKTNITVWSYVLCASDSSRGWAGVILEGNNDSKSRDSFKKTILIVLLGKAAKVHGGLFGFYGEPNTQKRHESGTCFDNSILKIVCLGCAQAILTKFWQGKRRKLVVIRAMLRCSCLGM